MKRVFLRLFLALFAIGFAFAIGEVVVRILGAAPELGVLSREGYRLSEDPDIAYEPLAYRGPPLPGSREPTGRRIVVIGDSIAAGMDVEQWDDVFSARLEAKLRAADLEAETVTLAAPGYNTQQQVATLAARGVGLDPDVVVVAYCLNDREGLDRRIVTALERDGGRLPGILRASALFRLLWFGVIERREAESGTIGGDTRAAAFARLAELAREHGFGVVVAVFPMFVDLYRYDELGEHAFIARECARYGFTCVDLLDPMRRAGGDLASDHYHPNARGHDVAADAVSDALRARFTGAASPTPATASLVRGLRHLPPQPTDGEGVVVNAFIAKPANQSATLVVRGGDGERRIPLRDDGGHDDGEAGDGIHGARIPARPAGRVVRYTVEVAAGGAAPSATATGVYVVAPAPDLRGPMLSEIAMNPDGSGWLELLNTGDRPVELGTLRVTDDPERPDRWRLPTTGPFPPGAVRVVEIRAKGDALAVRPGSFALFGDDGRTLLDFLVLPAWAKGSIGRLHARRPQRLEPGFVRLLRPTPGAANDAAAEPRRYTTLDPDAQELALDVTGTAAPGGAIEFVVRGAPAGGACRVILSVAAVDEPLLRSRSRRLVSDPPFAAIAADADAAGTARLAFTMPTSPETRDVTFYAQAWCDHRERRLASNAIALAVR